MLIGWKLCLALSVAGLAYAFLALRGGTGTGGSVTLWLSFIPALFPMWIGLILLRGYIRLNRTDGPRL
jgi:hypothetical protein